VARLLGVTNSVVNRLAVSPALPEYRNYLKALQNLRPLFYVPFFYVPFFRAPPSRPRPPTLLTPSWLSAIQSQMVWQKLA